ncbi:hypothetical protein C8046_03655 [Serinibacter arcticus]|uniref:Glycerol-3-phosphate ABC transporter, periplasmic glycerol-3-phosphate-binding protein n=2 Tax=Serinibacter arcticus TaxID=1655435 RepID=A0A2U1ZSI1_9MICO|nr:hypothetical protein C8046_03655 [Serinibacter arcticus]
MLLGSTLGLTLALPAHAAPELPDQPAPSLDDGPRVVVTELTNGGPGGYHDNFIEIANLGSQAQDLTGWAVFRCTGTGSVASAPQVTLAGVLEPGEVRVLARQHAQSTVDADQRYATSMANNSYGALIRDAAGATVDAVAVKDSSVAGAGCVAGTALPNVTDSVRGESWQRIGSTGDNLADFVRAPRTPGDPVAAAPSPEPRGGDVLISEVAHAGPAGAGDHLVEIGNYGTTAVTLEGWTLWRCNELGRRFAGDLIATALPSTLSPGEAVVVPTTGFVAGAAGVLLVDGEAATVDAVALADGQDSACAQGRPLPYAGLDAAGGDSYQRTAPEGDNRTAFVAAPRGPGQLRANLPTEPEPEPEEFLSTTGGPNVRVAELTNTGPAGNGDIFFELVNYGDEPQPLDGWSVYRCTGTGVRASVEQLTPAQLQGRVLAPGQRLTAARSAQSSPEVAAAADLFFDISFATQYGLIVFDESGVVVDRVGSARHDVESYCAAGTPLPGSLSGLYAETWQRVDLTGDARVDFVAAPRTPGAVNARAWERPRADSAVRVTELANGGPGGAADNFVEITNLGEVPVELGGWQLFRCTGTGRAYPDTRQLVLPAATLAPGASYVMGRTGGFTGQADVTYGTSLATDGGFGVVLTDAELRTVDQVGVFTGVDSACTTGHPLANDLDFGDGESWQRTGETGDDAADFARALRTPGVHGDVVPRERVVLEPGPVQITEVTNGGPADVVDGTPAIPTTPGSEQFVELAARGSESTDVSGWQVHYCSVDGRRVAEPQAVIPDGTVLAPGQAWTLVGPDAPVGLVGDAVATGRMDAAGYGVVVTDRAGAVVDRVGVYYDDVGLVTNAPTGPCRAGVPLDRRQSTTSVSAGWKHGLSFHRTQFTGDNYHDYVPGPRTPGEFVALAHTDPAVPSPGALDPVTLDRATVPGAPLADSSRPASPTAVGEILTARAAVDSDLAVRGGTVAEAEVRTFAGVSPAAPLEARTGAQEREVTDGVAESSDDARGYPYLRLEVAVGEIDTPVEVVWTGSTRERHELQLSVWDPQDEAWVLSDHRSGQDGEEVTLVAAIDPAVVTDGVATVLVQDGPRVEENLTAETDQAFETPGTYDFSIGHVTDTQYLVEQNPRIFTDINAWFAANAEARDVAFVMHTGDLIQNWLRGDQERDRAVEEFELASRVQEILETAGVPHSVLPGNHDNVWGTSNDLFDSYFPAERYADSPWFGQEGPLGMGAHYSTVERDGVKLLFLSLGYDTREQELVWAEDVIAAHPTHNVVIGTHEYLRPEIDERANPSNGRWTAQGDVYFERLVEPYDNVVMTLSGHLHGVRQRVLEDVGGTPGRTVVETVADYQSYASQDVRDSVFLRLYQVDVAAGRMAVNAFSPRHDSFEPFRYEHRNGWYTAESDELVLPVDLLYAKTVRTSAVTVLSDVAPVGGVLTLAGGEDGEVTWSGLAAGAEHGWYVTATGGELAPERGRPSAVATFVAALAPTEPGEQVFSDVAVGDLFHHEIAWLAEREVTRGWTMPDGTREFRPVTPVARDAMAAFLYRLAGSPEFRAPERSPFSDVAPDDQFYAEITWLHERGISTGWDNGDGTASFRPLAPIARDAMAAFLHRYAEVGETEVPAVSPFVDVATDNQFYAEIAWLAERGIATGWVGSGNDGTSFFQPLSSVNRDAMAAFMYRLHHLED